MTDEVNELLRLIRTKREALVLAHTGPQAEGLATPVFDAFEELLRLLPDVDKALRAGIRELT